MMGGGALAGTFGQWWVAGQGQRRIGGDGPLTRAGCIVFLWVPWVTGGGAGALAAPLECYWMAGRGGVSRYGGWRGTYECCRCARSAFRVVLGGWERSVGMGVTGHLQVGCGGLAGALAARFGWWWVTESGGVS